jgi:hypothetical protein
MSLLSFFSSYRRVRSHWDAPRMGQALCTRLLANTLK